MTEDNRAAPRQVPNRTAYFPVVILILVLAILLFASRQFGPGGIGTDHPAVGKAWPQIELQPLRLRGDELQDVSNVSGSISLIHFWGTWCGPCRMEYPELWEAMQTFRDREEVRFLPIACPASNNATPQSLAEETAQFFDQLQIASVAYFDPHGVTQTALVELLQQNQISFPTSVLVDQTGQVRGVWQGYAPETPRQIEQSIATLLAEQKST